MTIAADVTLPVQTLIMAGGRGERLYPLTASRPKPAVPFAGVFRIVDFTLSNCVNSGLKGVSLLTQYKHEEIQSYIRQSWSSIWSGFTQEPLQCLPPSGAHSYRGTADAVFQNIGEVQRRGPKFVLILSADHVYQMDYRKLLSYHSETNADLTIATVEHPLKSAKNFGVVEIDSDSKVIAFQEKPSNPRPLPSSPGEALVNMGVYVFKRELLIQALNECCNTGKGSDFAQHLIPSLIGSAHVRAFHFRDEENGIPSYWRDIGTIDSYYESSMELQRPGARFDPYQNRLWPSFPSPRYRNSSDIRARLLTNCRVRRSILSPGVHIGDGAVIDSSVLMAGVWIGKGAQIRRAIIDEGVYIPDGAQIGFDRESDRQRYLVTDTGVVVVSETPNEISPSFAFEARRVESRRRLLHSI